MARLVGVDLPRDKRLEVALTYIFGIGRTRAEKTLAGTGISGDLRVHELGDTEGEADDQPRPPGDQPRHRREQDGGQIGVPVEPEQILELPQILDGGMIGGVVAGHEDPADMRIEETALRR